MATPFQLPKASPVSAGASYASCKAYFYQAGTTTPISTYTTAALSVAHANPVVADANGVFAAIYVNEAVNATYRLQLKTSADVLIYDEDNIPTTLNQASLGAVLYPRTAAEIAASVTPISYVYPPGDIRRYGTNTTPGTTDMAGPLANGLLVSASHPLQLQQETYLCGSALTVPAQGQVYGYGKNSVVKKGFNGDLFTMGAQAVLRDFYIDGDGGTRTGRGVVISTGDLDEVSWRRLTRLSIINMASYCVEFTAAKAGYASMLEFCRMTTNDQVVEAVKLPDSEANNGNRFMIGCWTYGTPLIDMGGCDNMLLVGCEGAYPTMGTASKKVKMVGCRIVNNGPASRTNWTIQGTNHSITGCVSAVSTLTFNTSLFKSTFQGNSIASGTTYADTARGVIDGNLIDIQTTTYTPSWTATSGTAPAIGNGSIGGSWARIGERCAVDIKLTGGSTTTWGSAGYWNFSVPYTASRDTMGSCYIEDNSGVTTYVGVAMILSTTSVVFVATNAASAYLTYNSPIAVPATSDKVKIWIEYPIT